MPMHSTIWVACTEKIKVWIKVMREQKNITRQQKQGHAKAQCNLGGLYLDGFGVEQSNEIATDVTESITVEKNVKRNIGSWC